jgi:hypothetical protein
VALPAAGESITAGTAAAIAAIPAMILTPSNGLVGHDFRDESAGKGNKALSEEKKSDQESGSDRNSSDDQKLSPGEIEKLRDAGIDAEELKGGKATGKLDLYKDKKGNIYVKPKGGSGPGDPTGINIKNF